MKTIRSSYFVAVAASVLSAFVVGCGTLAAEPGATPLSPRSVEQVQASVPPQRGEASRPAIALVLGGGGLRGFAHVGVLRALEEAGIRPDIVVGTSAGAVVGAAYASGLSSSEVEQAARGVKLASLVDLTLSSSGVIRGDNLAHWVGAVTRHQRIENFPIRFAAVATDLQTQQAVVLDSGPAGRAVQASAAVPGINLPVPYPGGHLVDGGVASLVPVGVARAMGAEVVIAVDIYCNEPLGGSSLAAPAVVMRVMHRQSCLVGQQEMAGADLLIAPSIGAMKMSDKEQQDRAVAAGFDAAREALKRLAAGPGLPPPRRLLS